MTDGEHEEPQLQPGDLTADELVRLHRDLDPGPNDAGYTARWRDWQHFAAHVADDARRARVDAYIAAQFSPPNDDRIAGAGPRIRFVTVST